MSRYTYEGGREISKDGEPFFAVTKQGDTSPTEADAVAHFLVLLLNDADEDDDTFEEYYEDYMADGSDDESDDD